MRLELDRNDLEPELANIDSHSLVKFEDFKDEVQIAINAVGQAIFYNSWGAPKDSYQTIYSPGH